MATRDTRGTRTDYIYDDAGRRVSVVQAVGTELASQSYTCYDKAGRVRRTIANYVANGNDPDAWQTDAVETWLLDTSMAHRYREDNLIATTSYDAASRRQSSTSPMGNTQSLAYDVAGRVVEVMDARGIITHYSYDGLGRRTQVVQNRTLANPEAWVWSDVNTRWEDGASNPIAHGTNNDENIIVQVTYDVMGRVLTMRNPLGNVTTYAYDGLGRRTSLSNPLGLAWTTAYADVGNTTQTTQTYPGANDSTEYDVTRTFDRMGRLTGIQYGDTASTPDVALEYDLAGNRSRMSETDSTTTVQRDYAYDAMNRLKAAGESGAQVNYTYDAGGLRTQMTLPDGLSLDYAYDAKGQLIAMTDWDGGKSTFRYDNLGRHTRTYRPNAMQSRYRYDADGRLRDLHHRQGDETLAQFQYDVDANGNRTEAREYLMPASAGNATQTYAYNHADISFPHGTWVDEGHCVLSATNGTNIERFVHTSNGIHAVYANNSWHYFGHDALGSLRFEVNASTSIVASNSYTPYGNIVASSGLTSVSYGYAGQMFDDNGLSYNQNRYYAPEMGIWTKMDALETQNRYGYVNGNPIRFVDPSGLQALEGACLTAIFADGPIPIGDAICATAILASGLVALMGVARTASNIDWQALSQIFDRYAPAPQIADPTQVVLDPPWEQALQDAINTTPTPSKTPEQSPTVIPLPTPNVTTTPDENSCPTNHPPHSNEPFDTSRGNLGEMDDIMCNVRRYTASNANAPQPYEWWQSLRGRIQPFFASQWVGNTGIFVGRGPTTAKNADTGLFVNMPLGSIMLPRPGIIGDRADVMSLAVHELRHAGQYFSLFSDERIRGQRLSCPSISGRIAEVDAWQKENHWLVYATTKGLDPNKLSNSYIASEPYNNGTMWSVNDLWDHSLITQYSHPILYGTAFNVPPVFACPGISVSSFVSSSADTCINNLVTQHL